MLNTFYFISDI